MSTDFLVESLIRDTTGKDCAGSRAAAVQPKVSKKTGKKRKRANDENLPEEALPATTVEPKKKRVRTMYSKEILQQLQAIFAETPYPDLLMREKIAEQLGLTPQKIHVS